MSRRISTACIPQGGPDRFASGTVPLRPRRNLALGMHASQLRPCRDEGFPGQTTTRVGMHCPPQDRSLALMPAAQACALFTGRPVRFSVLRPPYGALGVGVLRVLRIRERDDAVELVAGYEAYERLPAAGRDGRDGRAP